jgi:hypothetical protein
MTPPSLRPLISAFRTPITRHRHTLSLNRYRRLSPVRPSFHDRYSRLTPLQSKMPMYSGHQSPYVTPHILHRSYAQAEQELYNSSGYQASFNRVPYP